MSPTFRSLSNRNYRLYAAGAIVSNVGTWMQRIAQDWLILQLTSSGTAIGITTGLQFLPILLLAPLAGLVADRVPKRRLLQVTQAMMAIPGFILGTLAVLGVAQPWHVYVLAFVFGVGTAFDGPARQSFVPEMVGPDELTNAVSLNSASFNTARIVGPALAGLLIAALGSGADAAGWVILFNSISYGAVIYVLERMDVSQLNTPDAAPRGRGMILDGVQYLRGRPDLMLVLTVVFFAGTFGMNFQLTSALMATQVFDKGADGFGLLGSVLAIGSLTGSLLSARRGTSNHRIVVWAALGFGAALIVSGLMPTYLLFAVWCPVVGFMALTMITAANSTMQLGCDPVYRGRVMSLYLMVFMGGTPLGSPLMGWVGEVLGARWTLFVGGALTVVGVFLAMVLYSRKSAAAIVAPVEVAQIAAGPATAPQGVAAREAIADAAVASTKPPSVPGPAVGRGTGLTVASVPAAVVASSTSPQANAGPKGSAKAACSANA